jgi:NADPH2:quinone reductase
MMKAIRMHQHGGPEVLRYEDVETPVPQTGEVLVRHAAMGVNYIDTYHRAGAYPVPMPSGLGCEAAGTVESVGSGVNGFAPGDRVAYAVPTPGSYAQMRALPADRLVRIPDAISLDTAASMMLKGLTAQFLFHRTYAVRAGDTVLLHAAAGGVGLIACQWLNALGATVIGTVGSDEKAALAREHGCHHTIVYTRENFVDRVNEITGGKGVPVVYDSVGKDTFDGSVQCLRQRGMMVLFGASSGAVAQVSVAALQKGSHFFTRPGLFHYIASRDDLESGASALFDMVGKGRIRIDVSGRYPLADAAQSHRDLAARRTTGSLLLLP